MLRAAILAAADNQRLEQFISSAPLTSSVVRRFVAGTATEDAVSTARKLHLDGYNTTIDHLGEDVTDPEGVHGVVDAYRDLIAALAEHQATAFSEVSVKLSSLGQEFDRHRAFDAAATICETAYKAGTSVTVDAEDYASIDATLEVVAALRRDFPDTGAVLQAYLRRTEADARDFAGPGSRVRLCKGAYAAPESVAYQQHHEVNLSYVRCLNVLLAGEGRPLIATHDPTLIAIATERAYAYRRDPQSYEFQMLFGAHPRMQRQLLDTGRPVRIYVPYGASWYRYLMRRMAERPANLAFFLRALAS